MLQDQHMQLESRFVKCVSQHSKYFLLNCYEVSPVELITELRSLPIKLYHEQSAQEVAIT